MKSIFPICFFASFFSLSTSGFALAQEKPVLDKYREVGPAIGACWKAPPGSAGSEMTVVFTFNKRGEIFGKPRITYSKLTGDPELQKEFVAAVFAAITKCTPLNFTEELGGAVAGRPFAMKFASTGRETGI